MKMKSIFIVVLLVIGLNSFGASTEADGFVKLNLKEYREAKQIFSELLKTNPENAVAMYGLGEYYFYTGKTDSAKIFYQKGIEVNSSYAGNYAGMGKVSLLYSPTDAESYFKDAVKKSKKNATAIVAIAKAYFELTPKKLDEAKRYVELAIEVDPKSSSAYMMNGLIELYKQNTGEAALQLERSIYFDANQYEAYLYQSDILVGARNYPQAAEYINKVIAIKPDYWIAYKKLGELYYNSQKYPESVTNFATYFKNVKTDNDVTHYAYSLFFNKQYKEAKDVIDILIKNNPNDYVPLRIQGYISYETKDLANGKKTMDKFFSLVPADKILADDYSYYGKMLSVTGNDSLAIINYKLALAKDSNDYPIYDELAKSSFKLKKYDQSLQYGRKYISKKPNLTTADYFQLGKSYYSIANSLNSKADSLKAPAAFKADSIKQMEYFVSADSLFVKVVKYSPNSYIGPFWRARVNSSIDRETTQGLAKPFYEKALEIVSKDPVKYKKELSEIYAYLGFYYYQKEDKPASLDNFKKLLEIDPENTKALEAIKALESK